MDNKKQGHILRNGYVLLYIWAALQLFNLVRRKAGYSGIGLLFQLWLMLSYVVVVVVTNPGVPLSKRDRLLWAGSALAAAAPPAGYFILSGQYTDLLFMAGTCVLLAVLGLRQWKRETRDSGSSPNES